MNERLLTASCPEFGVMIYLSKGALIILVASPAELKPDYSR
jgi:hypothetical protein